MRAVHRLFSLTCFIFLSTFFLTACEEKVLSRIDQCKQLTPVLLQQQLQLDKPPKLEWLMSAEEQEEEVQIQIALSFRILSVGVQEIGSIQVPDNDHFHPLASELGMNMVCRFVYQLHQQHDMLDGYEAFPTDIILNNQMIDPELIKDIHKSL
jgi:hypothetical protein